MAPSKSEQPEDAEPTCSIERTLNVVGDRWSYLILRQALMYGTTRFSEFQDVLGIAPNVLTDRLERMVSAGLLEKAMYREAGSRARPSYHPTTAGEGLILVLAAMQQWGDENVPPKSGPSVLCRSVGRDQPLHLAFVDETNRAMAPGDVTFRTAPGYDF